MLENQTIAFVEVKMSGMIRIGEYELLEKQKEGYENNGGNDA